MDRYDAEGVEDFFDKAADIMDYWNFPGYNSLSYDARNFYDSMHYRNKLGEMMLAKIFGNTEIDVPEDFGRKMEKK